MTRSAFPLIFYPLESLLSQSTFLPLAFSSPCTHIILSISCNSSPLSSLSLYVRTFFLFNPAGMLWSNTSSVLMAVPIQSHVFPTYLLIPDFSSLLLCPLHWELLGKNTIQIQLLELEPTELDPEHNSTNLNCSILSSLWLLQTFSAFLKLKNLHLLLTELNFTSYLSKK